MIFAALSIAAISAQGQNAPANSLSTDGVTIGGITWAARNVGAKGQFVDNPTDSGRYYTFEEAKTACPTGWRTPTRQEFELLAAASSEWTTVDDVAGRRFDGEGGSLFLPAAGIYHPLRKEVISRSDGIYWSSTKHAEYSNTNGYHLYFNNSLVNPEYHSNYMAGVTVRCVRQ